MVQGQVMLESMRKARLKARAVQCRGKNACLLFCSFSFLFPKTCFACFTWDIFVARGCLPIIFCRPKAEPSEVAMLMSLIERGESSKCTQHREERKRG